MKIGEPPAVRGPLDAPVVPLVAELDAMADGWLCAGLPDADLPRRAAREIERLHQELGECSVGWESGTKAIAENLVLRAALDRLAAAVSEVSGSTFAPWMEELDAAYKEARAVSKLHNGPR